MVAQGESSAFPVESVRERFPALSHPHTGREETRIFFDNPAGTQLPDLVLDAIGVCGREACANLGGYFSTSRQAAEIVHRAHEDAALLLGAASGEEIALGASMTELTYHVSRAFARTCSPGDEILVTTMDHEGNVSPWLQAAEDFGLVVRWVAFSPDTWRIEAEALRLVLSNRTKLLALNYASNLTGSINDVREITRIAREAGMLVYVDAVQFAPHGLIDVGALGCDFLVCSAYKFFGPHLGVLWGRKELLDRIPAYRLRCGPSGPAEKFERGTPQVELQAGLSASVAYLRWLGGELGENKEGRSALESAFAGVRKHEEELALQLLRGLSELPGVEIYGIVDEDDVRYRVPTVSIVHESLSSQGLAQELGLCGVHAWSGHNYAYGITEQLGLDMTDGVLRLGLVHYNTPAEVEKVLGILENLCRGGN